MKEDEWNQEVQTLRNTNRLKDKTEFGRHSFTYNWVMEDTTLKADLSLNEDGVGYGPLRKICISLKSEEGIIKQLPIHDNTDWSYNLQSCVSKRSFELVLKYLTKSYGNPDSVISDHKQVLLRGDKHLNTWTSYYFSSKQALLEVWHDELLPATARIPFDHYSLAQIVCKSKGIEIEAQKEAAARLPLLSPDDYIQIPVFPSIDFSTKEVTFEAKLRPLNRKNAIDARKITALRGKIKVTDQFADLIFESPEVTIENIEPIDQPFKPGHFPEANYDFYGSIEQKRSWSMPFSGAPSLYKAIMAFKKIEGIFIPTTILLDDGTRVEKK